MTAYRAYRLDTRHRIANATWLEAPDDATAVAQAEDLCDEGVPTVELWQAARLVEEIDCEATGACDCASPDAAKA